MSQKKGLEWFFINQLLTKIVVCVKEYLLVLIQTGLCFAP